MTAVGTGSVLPNWPIRASESRYNAITFRVFNGNDRRSAATTGTGADRNADRAHARLPGDTGVWRRQVPSQRAHPWRELSRPRLPMPPRERAGTGTALRSSLVVTTLLVSM